MLLCSERSPVLAELLFLAKSYDIDDKKPYIIHGQGSNEDVKPTNVELKTHERTKIFDLYGNEDQLSFKDNSFIYLRSDSEISLSTLDKQRPKFIK